MAQEFLRLWRACLAALVVLLMPAATANAEQPGGTLAGKMLVASETMGDPRFDRTVIYIIEHDARGAMGLVVNVPIADVPLATLVSRLGLEETGAAGQVSLFYGGPVEPDRTFLLHSSDVMPKGSVLVDDTVALTTHPEGLRAIARGEGPRQKLVVLGYAGWAPGQLEGELAGSVWFVIPGDAALIFAADPAQSWARAVARRGVNL